MRVPTLRFFQKVLGGEQQHLKNPELFSDLQPRIWETHSPLGWFPWRVTSLRNIIYILRVSARLQTVSGVYWESVLCKRICCSTSFWNPPWHFPSQRLLPVFLQVLELLTCLNRHDVKGDDLIRPSPRTSSLRTGWESPGRGHWAGGSLSGKAKPRRERRRQTSCILYLIIFLGLAQLWK